MLSEEDINRIAQAVVTRIQQLQSQMDEEFFQKLNDQGYKYHIEETPKETPEEFWLRNELKKFEKLKQHALKHEQYEKIPENIEIEETERTDEQKAQADERESMYLVSEYAKEYFETSYQPIL